MLKSLFIRPWRSLARHPYIVTMVVAVSVMGFLDPNSFYHKYLQDDQIRHLKAEIRNYQEAYDRDTKQYDALRNNPKAIVKLARERYFMKKECEDVFVVK